MPKQLFLKIFFGFWFVTVAQMAAILVLPKMLDSSLKVDPKLDAFHQKVAKTLQNSTNLDKAVKRLQHKMRPPHYLKKRIIKKRGRLDSIFVVNENNIGLKGERIPKDIYLALIQLEDKPKQRYFHYKRWGVYGPYKFEHEGQTYSLFIRDFEHKHRSQILNFLKENPWIVLAIVMIISAVICGLLAWHLSRPIRSLDRSAKRLAQGDLTARADKLALRYHDEIGQLAKSFNEMADSVQSMVNGQQRLLGDISHEIRTPLTRLQLANAIHRRQFGDNEELTRIEQETETIDKMLNQLLALSRSTLSGEHPFEHTDFSFFMEDIIDNARFEAHQAQVELVNTIAPNLTISVQWDSLASAIENIIRNAIRYAKQRVDFSAYQDADNLIINIVDDGCGVDDDHLSNLFTPFYRVSTSRDRKTGGTGLGLAIAHEAVKRHKGNIVANNNEQGGLTVTISLPLTSHTQDSSN